MDTRPPDFSVRYEWQEGSLPPPYHYEYTVTIGPDGQGEVRMIPDYPSAGAPEWTESFSVAAPEMDELFRRLVADGAFTQPWRAQDSPPVGGSSDSTTITANGQVVTIPAYVVDSQASAAADIANAVRSRVPQAIWDKLEAQRQQYVDEKLSTP